MKDSDKVNSGDTFELTLTSISSLSSSTSPSSGSYKRTMASTPEKQNSSSIYCRICHEDESLEELVDPCKCAGSVGLVHTSCLEKWLSTSNSDRCEICKWVFTIERKHKPIGQWWRSSNGNGARGIAGDAICLSILTPLCFAATYLCALGASGYSGLGYWEGTGLAILCSLLVITYCLWLSITVRFHYKLWRRWRKQNQDVILLVKHKADGALENNSENLSKKPPRNRQERNNHSWNMCGRPAPRFLYSIPFSHSQDPTYTFHQQTSFV
ncbi:E3 ubiquitin-protein ligase MARCHF3-like [Athalia rosae]|uniref:E3 ubiquitin-protein ligase MARCHF3-like n=1 Tax=Athalia rosae TaxID=37344 RepID=UPI002033B2F3|nr:E3 ubiquitin-protein ligase MARCHF3-like [Athalia rosae]